MNNLKIILFWISFLILSSCNVGQPSSSEASNNNLSGTIRIGHINSVPYSASIGDYALLAVTNNSNHTMSLSSIEVLVNNNKVNYNDYLDKSDCSIVPSLQTCYLKIFANKHDGYLLSLGYTDNSQNTINLKQIINFTNSLSKEDVAISNQENWVNDLSGLSIPIILNKSYDKLTANLGNINIPIICSHSSASAHNLCTILVPAMNISSINNSLRVMAYNRNSTKSDTSYTTTITLTKNASGNIVASAINPVISPADGSTPVTITLLNNGLASVTALSVSGVTPITVQNNCTTSLNPSQTCTFSINATSTTSGQSSAIITYKNDSGTQVLVLNASYISKTPSPGLTLSTNGSFTNIVTSQAGYTYLTVNVMNTGNTALSNLNFNNLNLFKSNMFSFMPGSTCVNGGSLAVGASCNMILAYKPTSAENGTVKFILTANYTNNSNQGQLQTYSNSSLTIPYSAVTGAVFKAVGDFGMVITSPAGANGTWIANVNSPFSGTSVSGNKMLINNDTYVVTMSSGEIKYSQLKGLFWESSLLGGTGGRFNSSTCSVVFDGTYYYTCGGKNLSLGAPCTGTSGGCIVRTNNLGGANWERLNSASGSTPNDIGYFTNGSSYAYVVTTNDPSANRGLIASSNGNVWSSVNSSQPDGYDYTNFGPLVYNSTTSTITAFSAAGGCSSANFSNFMTTWTACTGTLSNDNVFGAAYGNNFYVALTPSLWGGTSIWSTTGSPNNLSNWGEVNKSQLGILKRITYLNNIGGGIFFAAGDQGANATASNPGSSINWTTKADIVTGQNTKPNVAGLAYDGTTVWLTGTSTILKSTNAESWITPGLQSITKMGESYLAVDNQGNIFYSADSSKWQLRSNPTANILNSVYCLASNLCFAVGNNGTILKSTDTGINWVQLSSGTSADLKKMYCTSDNVCLVVGGRGLANSGTILISYDYTNWSLITTSLATTSLNDVTYFNDSYIVIGNSGTIFISPNAIGSWLSASSNTTENLNSIACTSAIGCVAVGNAGTIRRSSSLTNWSSATSNTTNDILSITYNGVFVIVGKGGVLRYSSDGSGGGSGTWYSATFPTTSSATNNLTSVISN